MGKCTKNTISQNVKFFKQTTPTESEKVEDEIEYCGDAI